MTLFGLSTKGHLKISRIEPAPGVDPDRPSALRASRSAEAMASEAKAQEARLRQLEAWSQSTDARPDYDLRASTR